MEKQEAVKIIYKFWNKSICWAISQLKWRRVGSSCFWKVLLYLDLKPSFCVALSSFTYVYFLLRHWLGILFLILEIFERNVQCAFRSALSQMFFKIGVLKNVAIFRVSIYIHFVGFGESIFKWTGFI